MKPDVKHAFKQFIWALYSFDRLGVIKAILLMVSAAFVEGFGLILIIPLLGFTGIGNASLGNVSVYIRDGLNFFGLSFSLPVLLVIYLILAGIRMWVIWLRDISSTELHLRYSEFLRNGLWLGIVHSQWHYFSKIRTAEFLHVLTNETQRIGLATYGLIRLFSVSIMMMVYFIVALNMSLNMTLVVSIGGMLLFIPMRKIRRQALDLGKGMSGNQREIFAVTNELLSGMKTAKAQASEEGHCNVFQNFGAKLKKDRLKFQKNTSFIKLVFQWGGAAILALMVWLSVEKMDIASAELLVLIAIFARMVPFLQNIEQSYVQVIHALPAFNAYRAMDHDVKIHCEPMLETNVAVQFEKDFTLDKVSFSHNEGIESLHNVSFTVPVRHIVALVGPSGAGKSTIVDLLGGLLCPDEGNILLDGIKLNEETRIAWRRQIAYVPQETYLLDADLRSNLQWGNKIQDDDKLYEALKIASAFDFVNKLPAGLDTAIGKNGVGLSYGERQRIALARAVLKKPKLLILDEVTSALDRENSLEIERALLSLKDEMTVCLITHKLASLSFTDWIVVVEEGRVNEQGSWNELISNDNSKFKQFLKREIS